MNARLWTLLIALSILWGGSFLFAEIALREGRFRRATEHAVGALETWRHLGQHAWAARCHGVLGSTALAAGERERARSHFVDALSLSLR